MPSILVCYATGEGQTAKVANRIVDHLQEWSFDAVAVDVNDDAPAFAATDYDAVVVGSSIHAGSHSDRIKTFVEASRDVLDSLPTAFFQVCLSSVSADPERQADAARYVDEFLEATGWRPGRVGTFGGALRYSEYGFLKRLMMKQIAKDATGDTDTSRDYEYTDWDAVEAFANDFAALVVADIATDDDAGDGDRRSADRTADPTLEV